VTEWHGTFEIPWKIIQRMFGQGMGGRARHGESICGSQEHAFETAIFGPLRIIEKIRDWHWL
jgi:hypothetical protein